MKIAAVFAAVLLSVSAVACGLQPADAKANASRRAASAASAKVDGVACTSNDECTSNNCDRSYGCYGSPCELASANNSCEDAWECVHHNESQSVVGSDVPAFDRCEPMTPRVTVDVPDSAAVGEPIPVKVVAHFPRKDAAPQFTWTMGDEVAEGSEAELVAPMKPGAVLIVLTVFEPSPNGERRIVEKSLVEVR